MAIHKSATALAMDRKREAHTERTSKPCAVMAPFFDGQAAELLSLVRTPEVGAGGEIVRAQSVPDQYLAQLDRRQAAKRTVIRNTLAEGATRIAEDASIRRTDLLMQPSFDLTALAIDTAESIGAENSVEKMLAHQMALAHEAAMRMMDRALSYSHSRAGDQVEACRCINAAARLISAFNDSALTLQRLRTGGSQTVTVQHVNVESGAQAVIGNVQTGGQKRRGTNGK